GLHVVAPDSPQAFIFYKTTPRPAIVTYDSVNDRRDRQIDWLPTYADSSMVIVQGANGAQAAPLDIGFDINGMPTITPAAAFPYCIRIRDTVTPSIDRRGLFFCDGRAKVSAT